MLAIVHHSSSPSKGSMGGRQQDMDMSVAAAYAAGGTFDAPLRAPRAPHQQRVSPELLPGEIVDPCTRCTEQQPAEYECAISIL